MIAASTRPPLIRLYEGEIFVDEFAGGGGTSEGVEMAIGRPPDVALNHNADALAMHARNHPLTRHILSDVFAADPVVVAQGKPVGGAWFSPDCTEFSKAKGGKPNRDPRRARRTRGLAWVVIKWATAPEPVRPRVIFVENVEEFQQWSHFAKWVAKLRKAGYVVEWRELRASHFGAPTSRKRLFIIARRDGRQIRWPAATHGPKQSKPFRTAAECIDFSIPVPSIFFTPGEARAWARARGVGVPKRPLAEATLRRIARGIDRYVLKSAQPFIVNTRHQGDDRVHSLLEPLRTIVASDREVAIVAPTLIQVGYGERPGQQPRTLDLFAPLGTAVGGGIKHALVAAFLAKHNGGNEATGQSLSAPADTITTIDQKALVTSHLLKLYGTSVDGAPVTGPMPTVTSHGNHIAEVRAFLVKFYGSKKDGNQLAFPLDTVTTKDRFGLVTVTIAGEQYVIADIGMRMLSPRELFTAQGFPVDYHIDAGTHPVLRKPVPFTKKTQTRLVGNSVPPHLAAALVGANLTDEPAA